ncbi:Uncharacterised protein [Mycobacterium tuberculosis]|nr:Uncharacterised protein [Mycobacterium tuberculosis]
MEVGDNTRQLPHRARDGDAEHTLAALQEVDDLLGRRALVHGGPIGEQGDVGQILDATLAQMVNCNPDVVQRDTGVEQPFDDLENQDVLERVQPLAAGSCRTTDRRHNQRCARPIVELAVGDPSDLAGARSAITYQLVRNGIVGEQAGLHGSAGRSGAVVTITSSARVVSKVELVLTWLLAQGASSRRSRSCH